MNNVKEKLIKVLVSLVVLAISIVIVIVITPKLLGLILTIGVGKVIFRASAVILLYLIIMAFVRN